MRQLLVHARNELEPVSVVSLIILLAAAAFFLLAVKPLAERRDQLDRELKAAARPVLSESLKLVDNRASAVKVAAFYTYFDRTQRIDDWLAKLYGIAKATGLELQAGDYQLAASADRLDRYRIRLPMTGTYSQIRGFLQVALAEVPVLSLDQATFKRKQMNSGVIESEIVLTLHVLRK